jgi:iron(III) transport system substrate-binding protein
MLKRTTILMLAMVLLVMLAACSQTTGSNNSGKSGAQSAKGSSKEETVGAADNKSAESAKVEGALSFYTSQPDADAAQLVEAFNAEYPDVKVNIFRSGTEEVISKIQAEEQAGSIQADVLLVADAVTFMRLKEQDLLLPYQSKEHDQIPSQFVDPDFTYSGTKIISTALAINTEKVKDIPDSWGILTSSEAKGQAIMPSPLYSGAAAYNVGVFTRSDGFGWEFFEQLKANDMTVSKGNGAVLKSVASGEKSYAMVVEFIVARAEQEGSPVKLIYPKEGVPAVTEPVGIMKGTQNEMAAKAFVDFVLSDKGQEMQASLGYTPIRMGVKAPAGLKSVDELKVISTDLNEIYMARDEDKQQFSSIFGE